MRITRRRIKVDAAAAQKILISCFCRHVHVAVDGAVRRQEAARHLNILRPFIGCGPDHVTDDVAAPETDRMRRLSPSGNGRRRLMECNGRRYSATCSARVNTTGGRRRLLVSHFDGKRRCRPPPLWGVACCCRRPRDQAEANNGKQISRICLPSGPTCCSASRPRMY